MDFFHYDFYAQTLSKIERWHERDEPDVYRMLADGLVQWEKLWELFCAVESNLIRYPAIHPESLRGRVKSLVEKGTV